MSRALPQAPGALYSESARERALFFALPIDPMIKAPVHGSHRPSRAVKYDT